MATTAAQRLASLKAARDTGVLTIKEGDTLTTYRSLDEINSIIDTLEAEVATDAGARKSRIRYLSVPVGKGL